MTSIELAPYIFFDGNCREAFEFYEKVFGGKLNIMAYEDVPGDFPGKEQMIGRVMNASLTGGDVVLRGSDIQKASPETKKVELCLTSQDETKMRKIYESLSNGGKAKMPLKKEFWGDIFGTVTDKYGVDWMIDIMPAGGSQPD